MAGFIKQDIKPAFPLALPLRYSKVVERGEELEPPLNSRVVVPYFANDLNRFLVRKYAVTSESFDGPDNAAILQAQRDPVPLEIEGSAADISNGPYRAVRLFLLERGTKAVVAVHVEGAGAVDYGAPVRKDQRWWGSELGEDLTYDNFHSRRKVVLHPLPEKDGERAFPLGQVR